MTAKEIAVAIMNGECDDHIDYIINACTDRRNAMARQKVTEFKIGDQVVFNYKTRPKYLQGCTGVIRAITGDRKCPITVYMDHQPRGRFSRTINTSAALIDKFEGFCANKRDFFEDDHSIEAGQQ